MMKTMRVMMMAGLMSGVIAVNALTADAVKVAILDSGANTAYKEGISLIDGTVKDYNGHGTLMARIVKEVNPRAELYIVKVMGKDGLAVNEQAVILGLEWAISRGVDVINMSLRLRGSEKLHRVIRKANEKGIVIVAAAGNKSSKADSPSAKNTRYAQRDTRYEIAYPAKYDEVIAVGALDRNAEVYGDSIKGDDVRILCKGYKGKKAGTSIASAYAAGFAAKIISENPNSGLQEIKEMMIQKTEGGGL